MVMMLFVIQENHIRGSLLIQKHGSESVVLNGKFPLGPWASTMDCRMTIYDYGYSYWLYNELRNYISQR